MWWESLLWNSWSCLQSVEAGSLVTTRLMAIVALGESITQVSARLRLKQRVLESFTVRFYVLDCKRYQCAHLAPIQILLPSKISAGSPCSQGPELSLSSYNVNGALDIFGGLGLLSPVAQHFILLFCLCYSAQFLLLVTVYIENVLRYLREPAMDNAASTRRRVLPTLYSCSDG